MDVPVETSTEDMSSVDALSPYRRIETSHAMTPGGTLVTTTTTTTERLRDQRGEPTYHGLHFVILIKMIIRNIFLTQKSGGGRLIIG